MSKNKALKHADLSIPVEKHTHENLRSFGNSHSLKIQIAWTDCLKGRQMINTVNFRLQK